MHKQKNAQSNIGSSIHSKIQQLEDLICDVFRDLVPFVQFKKREKHPWKGSSQWTWT